MTDASRFFIAGGTLRHDAPSYVRRRADEDLYDGLRQGQFCYVLTSRQMGKSSLMGQVRARLRADGVTVVPIDLTAIGQNLTPEQWYEGLLSRLGVHLGMEDELERFWEAHRRVGPLQRLMRAIREVVLPTLIHRGEPSEAAATSGVHAAPQSGPGRSAPDRPALVISVDEIDAVLSLPFSTDEFFAAIRECYNRRTEDPELNLLTFCLLGVASPADLVRDPRTTPFNIGRRIEVDDFTPEEAAPLAVGLAKAPSSRELLQRILYWTGGHPYLTQRLCQAVAEDASVTKPAGVDRLCEELFLSSRARERDDNLLYVRERILRSGADLAGLLELYHRVWRGRRVRDDQANPLVAILSLSGITRSVGGFLRVRNRIYHRVFDRAWIAASMPDAEVRRQRAAYRRGLVRAAALSSAVIAAMAVLAVKLEQQRSIAEDALWVQRRLTRSLDLRSRQRKVALEREREALAAEREASQQRAQAQRDAERQRDAALAAQRRAHLKSLEAERAADRAAIAAQRARAGERAAREAAGRERRSRYVSNVRLAATAWERGSAVEAAHALAALWPRSGQEDLRGFDWRYQWRLLQGEGLILRGHWGAAVGAAIGRGGDYTTLDEDLQVRRWRRDGRQLGSSLDLRRDRGVTAAALSPDGDVVAVGTEHGPVRVLGTPTGRLIRVLEGHGSAVRAMAFDAAGEALLSVDGHGEARVWEVASGLQRAQRQLASSVGAPSLLALPTGSRALLAGGTVGVARAEFVPWAGGSSGFVAALGQENTRLLCVACSPDGRLVAMGGSDGSVVVWDVARRKERLTLPSAHAAPVTALAFTHDGTRVASGSEDATVRIWDAESGRRLRTLVGHTGAVTSVTFGRGTDAVATCSTDGTVRLWRLAPPAEPWLLAGHSGEVQSLAFSPDSRLLASVSRDGTAKLWEPLMRREVAALDAGQGVGPCLACSPDGRLLAFGSGRTIALWDRRLRRIAALLGTTDWPTFWGVVRCLAFSPDGRLIAAGPGAMASGDGRPCAVGVWNVATRCRVASLGGLGGSVTGLSFSGDGRVLLGCDRGGRLLVWEVGSYRELRALSAPGRSALALALAPDGRQLAIGGADGAVWRWALPSWRRLAALRGHTTAVTGLCFSPDARTLASAGSDRSVRLWDVATGSETRVLAGYGEGGTSLAFSPDGRMLGAAGAGDRVPIWYAPSLAEIQTAQRRAESCRRAAARDRAAAHAARAAAARAEASRVRARVLARIPQRSPAAGPQQVDLSRFYNRLLEEVGLPGSTSPCRCSLAHLPVGVPSLMGSRFDVRGAVVLASPVRGDAMPGAPRAVQRIPVGQRCRSIHFLHAATHVDEEGARVGSYLLHYANGEKREVPIRYGIHARGLYLDRGPTPRALRVGAGGLAVYKCGWDNPLPHVPVRWLDVRAGASNSAPVLLAVTLEDRTVAELERPYRPGGAASEEVFYRRRTPLPPGIERFARAIHRTDARGRALESTYWGPDGRPATTRQGHARRTARYDRAGRLVREAFFAASGVLILALQTRYDPRGRVVEVTCAGPRGQRLPITGWVRRTVKHDSRLDTMEETYWADGRRPLAPRPLDERFDDIRAGHPPGAPALLRGASSAMIQVTDRVAASGRHSLRIGVAPGASPPPLLVYRPYFTSGAVRLSCDLLVEGEGGVSFDWRDADGPYYNQGPSFGIEGGRVVAGAAPLMPVPTGAWIHLEAVCALGASWTGTYDLAISGPGMSPRRFDRLQRIASPFRSLVALVVEPTDGGDGSVYLDNLKLVPATDVGPAFNAIGSGPAGIVVSESLLRNGSLEPGRRGLPRAVLLRLGSQEVPGWTIVQGTGSYFPSEPTATHGTACLVLGDGPSAIAQAFPTVPGRRYRVTFDLAGEPTGPTRKRLRVSAAGQMEEFLFDTTGTSVKRPCYVGKTWHFIARDRLTTLEFSTPLEAEGPGAALDNIAVVEDSER